MRLPWFFTLFILGFLFRILIFIYFPQSIPFDQEQYVNIAQSILDYKLYVSSFRVYGYPMFLAVIFSLAKLIVLENLLAARIVQSILDTLIALLIYILGKKIFNPKIAKISCIIYLFNPFTASAAGVILPETISSFIIITIYLLTYLFFKKKTLVYAVLLGFLLGFLPQARPALIM